MLAALAVLFVFGGRQCAYSQTVNDNSIESRFEAFSKLLSPEKLYLHTDKEFYCAGDTLWFKGYLVNSSYLSEFPESNYIYVELIGYDYEKNVFSGKTEEVTKVLSRVKVKRRGGALQGYVLLPGNMNTGAAVLRGYSYWNLNFPADYIFSKNLHVVNPMKDNYLHDLISNKVKERDEYTKIGVEYPFDSENKADEDIDCQFFPESGRLLEGMKSTVAFKAVSENGLGEKVTGIVYDDGGEKVLEFESNDLGFGKFSFAQPVQGLKYYAVVSDSRGIKKKIQLPEGEKSGVVINITEGAENIISKVYCTPDIKTDSLRYILHNGSEIFYNQPLEKVRSLAVAKRMLIPGIIDAAVSDSKGNIYASRQFFIMPRNTFSAVIKTDKDSYGSRERVNCTITITDSTETAEAGDFSLSVTDNKLAPYSGADNNIVSYMLLSGELKGFIENPQSYFDPDIPLEEREKRADLLMLTQGWKYYDLEAVLKGENEMPVYGKEYIQTISGRVKGVKHNKSSLVSFVAPSIHFSAVGQLDSTGFFELRDLSFPDSTLFIVNAEGLNGRKSFIPTINDDAFAPMLKYYRRPGNITYNKEVGQDLMQKYYKSGGDIVYQLDPLYVISNRKIKTVDNPSPIPEYAFKKGQLRQGKDLEPFKNYDLMSYVYETCQGLRFKTDTTTGERILVCRVPHVAAGMTISDGWEEILVFINGASAFSSSELQSFMVTDISSLAYLTGADAAPFSPMMTGSTTVRSVIMIKTALGKRTGVPRNVTKGYPMGWQKPEFFYSPVYDVRSKRSIPAGSDKRSTVYWNSELNFSADGKADISFDTSDGDSNYTLILEGITADGDYLFRRQEIKRHVTFR